MMPSPEGQVLSEEDLAVIDRAVKDLPPRQRLVFVLKQFEDMSFANIAEMLEITEGGAKASYHKALLTLRIHLKGLAPETARTEGSAPTLD
jgi:RNA polymerase sigma-70 factor (ECF subfamily)